MHSISLSSSSGSCLGKRTCSQGPQSSLGASKRLKTESETVPKSEVAPEASSSQAAPSVSELSLSDLPLETTSLLVLDSHTGASDIALTNLVFTRASKLGGAHMTETCRTRLLTEIMEASAIFTGAQLAQLVSGLANAMGGTAISDANRDALLAAVLGAHVTCSPLQTARMFEAAARAMGGPLITEVNRKALFAHILDAIQPSATRSQIRIIVLNSLDALGGAAMTDAILEATLRQILGAHTRHRGAVLEVMIEVVGTVLGGGSMTEAHRNIYLAQIMAAAPALAPQKLDMTIFGAAFAFGARVMTIPNLRAFQTSIAGAWSSCSPQQMGAMTGTLVRALGGRDMTELIRAETLANMLASHAQCNAEQLCAMIVRLGLILNSVALTTLLRCDASPVKKGMMIAKLINWASLTEVNLDVTGTLWSSLDALETELPDSTAPYKHHVMAGCLAALTQASVIADMEGLGDPDKLSFIAMCYRLRTVTAGFLEAEWGSLMAIKGRPSLKVQALTILLKSGPPNLALFKIVRSWQIGVLSGRDDPEAGGKAALAYLTWHIDFHGLYHETRHHMDREFIEKEKLLISRSRIVPLGTKKIIIDLLEKRDTALSAPQTEDPLIVALG